MTNPVPETRVIIPHKPLADLSAAQLRTLVALLLQELLATVDAYELESCETLGEAKPVSDQFPVIEGATDLGRGM